MAFNCAMKKPTKRLHADSKLIAALGGPTALAKKMGMDPSAGGVQRVQNWMTRGIPSAVKWDYRHVFAEAPTKPAEQGTPAKSEAA